MRTLMSLGVCVAFCLLSSAAQAQLTFLGDPELRFYDLADTGGGPYRLNDDISNAQASGTDDGFRITGDATFYLDRSLLTPDEGFEPVIGMDVRRYFQVGPLPVRVQGNLVENYEVVIGNGSTAAPAVRNSTGAFLLISDPIGGFAFLPTSVYGTDYGSSDLVGNGVRIFNTDASGPEYILAPGFQYFVEYQFRGYIDSTSVQPNDPTPAVTFEFGGVSHFDGMDISVHSELVPEPSTAMLAGLGGAAAFAVAMRRRAKRRVLRRAG